MTPKRKKRLTIVALIVLGVGTASALVLMALNENINLFFTPTQVAAGEAPVNHTFRLGGMVENDSVKRDKNEGLTVSFDIGDGAKVVTVDYTGILPDLFREGQGIVAMGKLDSEGVFVADEVLAKHDENYMPPEAKYAMDQAKLNKIKLSVDKKSRIKAEILKIKEPK